MAETPIIDEAVRAGAYNTAQDREGDVISFHPDALRLYTIRALRAAFPRDPTPETIRSIKRALGFTGDAGVAEWTTDAAHDAYHALPIYRELWGDEG